MPLFHFLFTPFRPLYYWLTENPENLNGPVGLPSLLSSPLLLLLLRVFTRPLDGCSSHLEIPQTQIAKMRHL